MKNKNSLIVNEEKDTFIENNITSFQNDFEKLKSNIIKMRKLEDEISLSRSENRKLAEEFIKRYNELKPELGKIVSWLGDSFTRDELVSILGDSVKTDGWGQYYFDLELANIKSRLSEGFKKPESYGDDRVNSLVSILDNYGNYISKFDSIELDDKSNCLDKDNYLINDDLQDCLVNSYNYKHNRHIHKSDKGIYVIVFNRLKNTNTLIYKYIKYPYLFKECLFNYIYNESNALITHNSNSIGIDYLFFIDSNFYTGEFSSDILTKFKNRFINNYYEGDYNKIYPRNIIDLFKILVKGCPIISNEEYMRDFIKLSVKGDSIEISQKLLDLYKWYNDDDLLVIEKLRTMLNNYRLNHFNMLTKAVFVVEDLNNMLSNLSSDWDGGVNGGPQKWRDQSDSLINTISVIDNDFRKSLNRHNQYHFNNGSIGKDKLLGRSNFSYQNIHLNIGNVRWYSTKREVPAVNSRQHMFQDNYREIGILLDKNYNLGSTKTQKEIELLLLNQENRFNETNKHKLHMNFSEEGYTFLKKKEIELSKLLDNPDKLFNNNQMNDNRYIPWFNKITKQLGKENVVNLLLDYFFDVLTNETIIIDNVDHPGIPTITAFSSFGKKITNKYIYSLYKEQTSSNVDISLSQFKEGNEEFKEIFQEDNFYARVGGFFVWNLVTVKLLYQDLDNDPSDNKKTDYYLRIVNNVRSIYIKDSKKVFHLPQQLPMVCEPKDFVITDNSKTTKLGGYLLNDVYYTDEIFKKKIGYEFTTELLDSNVIVSLINGLAKTPYKINEDTLQFVYQYGIEKNMIIDETKPEIINFLKNPYNDNLLKREKKMLRSQVSKILMEKSIISIATTYSKVNQIYFPVRLDNRTRIYCETDYLDYQKNDLAKGLISFARPGIINKGDLEVIKYFKAYGANMFGENLDKKSLNFRVKWIDEHTEEILNFDNNDIVDRAEDKTCFVSFCFEYKRFVKFMNNKEALNFYTYLPIQLDATCNGYQHLALLTKENKLFDKLNLDISTHDDDPGDFYTYLINKTENSIKLRIEYLKSLTILNEKQEKELGSLIKLNQVKFGRKIMKKVIMTKSYNAGMPKQVNFIIEDENIKECFDGNLKYYLYKDLDIQLKRYDIAMFVISLRHVIDNESPKIKELSKYLNGIVNACTALSIPIPWVRPHGAKILSSYEIEEMKQIKAFSFIKSKYTFKRYIKGKYDLVQQKKSLMPNFIHSLDATTIALLYDNLNYIDMFTIHDCFAVTANNVPTLINKLKFVYLDLYSSSTCLESFDRLVRTDINTKFEDKVFKIDGNSIHYDGKVIPFPNISKVLELSSDVSITNLTKSSNILV